MDSYAGEIDRVYGMTKLPVILMEFGFASVSYTHLDVYKRQELRYAYETGYEDGDGVYVFSIANTGSRPVEGLTLRLGMPDGSVVEEFVDIEIPVSYTHLHTVPRPLHRAAPSSLPWAIRTPAAAPTRSRLPEPNTSAPCCRRQNARPPSPEIRRRPGRRTEPAAAASSAERTLGANKAYPDPLRIPATVRYRIGRNRR